MILGSTTEGQLAYALRYLGETADEVASGLRFGGWLGLRNDASACPVARYLSTVIPGATGAAVGTEQATVHRVDGPDIEIDLTAAVADFVLAFDIGGFPDLAVQNCDNNGDVID